MSSLRNSPQNETDNRNNNEELEELISNANGSSPHGLSSAVHSTVAAVTSIFRWSPQHTSRKRSAESDQDSQSSGSMNSDSPSKPGLSKFSSAPYLQARYEEKKDESVEAVESAPNFTSGFTNGGEVRHRHSFNSNYDKRRTSDSSLRETEQKSSGDSVSWGKGVGVSLDKTDSKSSKSPILGGSGISRGKSLSFRESPSPSKTPSKLVERSDSGSRSSTEFVRSHSRERSFEKSLENIMDKCSEKSLDMNVSLDSKNGMVSDSSRVEDSSLLAAKKSADKSDKKKKNTPWYTASKMWNTSYKTKSEDFRKIFKDVYREDRLLVDYSCALQKEILVQGRMYITQNWVCFYANIFTWETLLAIPCKEITSVTKEKTARVIPNAIQITTDKEKYFFTSLANRDKTYMMLFRVWQNALLGQPMTAKEMWQWIHCNYGEELCLDSSDDDYVAPPSFIDEPIRDDCITPSRLNQMENPDSDILPSPELMQDDLGINIGKDYEVISSAGLEEKQCENVATDQSDTTEDSEEEVTLCSEHAHFEKPMIDEVYTIPVEKMFEMLFTESDFYSEIQTRRGSKDFTFTPWKDMGHGKQTRTVSYTIQLNYSIGPKSSQAVELQTCYKNPTPGTYFTVDTECSCLGIPYGNTFIVVNKYCVSKVSRYKSRIQISSEVRYKKSVWGLVKSMIEKNSIQGCLDYFNTLSVHLKQESDKFESSHQLTQASSKRKIRKRRIRTQHSAVPEIHKLKPTRHLSLIDKQTRQPVKSPLITPSTPVRSVTIHKEDISKLNADTLVRVILVVLVLLVIFNAILFYKLWSLESYTNVLYFPKQDTMAEELKNYPKSQEEWTQLLQQQRQLHESEIDRWKEIIATSIDLIDQVKNTMVNVKTSLEGRLKSSDIFTDNTS